MGLGNEQGFPRKGEVSSIDNRLDASSGTIRLRAVFDNSDGMLLPGLYARIRLGGGAPHSAVLIEETAIGTDQNKRFVVVVDEQNHTAYREVDRKRGVEGKSVAVRVDLGGRRKIKKTKKNY